MGKNVLLGNGINIQFGGFAYSSDFILKRIKYNSRLGKYDRLFNNKITGKEIENVFKGFVDIANAIIENKYECLTDDQDILDAIMDFKNRYPAKVTQPHEIMLEDWLLLVNVFFLVNENLMSQKINAVQGFEQLLLDAIFNDGEIQKIHQRMNRETKKFFKGYDKIFTLNYDDNIELLTGKSVFHLHGDFSVLHNSENENTVQGYIRTHEGTTVWFPEMAHCYCNALLNYSGRLKYKTAEDNHKAIIESEKFPEMLKKDPDFVEKVAKNNPEIGKMIRIKLEHPELQMATEYYFYELENAEGELDIIGMSPNNDAHIFDVILNNDKLRKITFYYFSEKERIFIEDNFSGDRFACRSVNDLWKTLNCAKKIYFCNYNVPDAGKDIIKALNILADDEIGFEDIKKKINQIPQFEMNRLSKIVEDGLNKVNPNHQSLNEQEFEKENALICHIALQEGIHPSVLYLICVMS